MRKKAKNKVDQRLEALILKRDTLRNNLLNTSDKTRDTVGSIQHGLYFAQLGMSVFRTLTNYHLSPKKRIQKVVTSLLLVAISKALKSYLTHEEETDEQAKH
jgi:hypothetical protein